MTDNPMPSDPFLPQDLKQWTDSLQNFYACAMQSGFPEARAFELTQDLFRAQMLAVNIQAQGEQ